MIGRNGSNISRTINECGATIKVCCILSQKILTQLKVHLIPKGEQRFHPLPLAAGHDLKETLFGSMHGNDPHFIIVCVS